MKILPDNTTTWFGWDWGFVPTKSELDVWLHGAGFMCLFFICYHVTGSAIWAGLITWLIGWIKEGADVKFKNAKVEVRDLSANTLGILDGMVFVGAIPVISIWTVALVIFTGLFIFVTLRLKGIYKI